MSNFTPFNQRGVDTEEKTMALLAHLLGFFSSILAPLLIYLLQKDKSKFVAFHSMQAILFEVFFWAIYIVLFTTIVGILLIPFAAIAHLIFGIIAIVRSAQGDWYEIPVIGKLARNIVGC